MITILYLIFNLVTFVFTGETFLPEHLKGRGFLTLPPFMLIEFLIEAFILMLFMEEKE